MIRDKRKRNLSISQWTWLDCHNIMKILWQ